MTLSDRSLKKLKDFLNPSIKVKHRFASLESFHECASDLELAEFYEENWELLLVFTFECYLLMISKIWVMESASHRNCSIFAFGRELAVEEGEENSLLKQIRLICDRIKPVNSEERDKWAGSLRRDPKPLEFLKFPIVFAKLLQLVPAGRLLSSSLSGLLVVFITRLLHGKNVPIFRVEGLKMLLTWLKTSSYTGDGERAAEECVRLFSSLVNVECLGVVRCQQDLEGEELLSTSSTILLHGPPLLSVAGVKNSAPVDAEAVFKENLAMLNEIFAFITWDINPDLHSTRFLWGLLRDHYLSSLFSEAYQSSSKNAFRQARRISQCSYDRKIRYEVLEVLVDYLSLWLIKSGSGSSDRFSVMNASGLTGNSASNTTSMLNLAVSDLSNLFSVLGRTQSILGLGASQSRQDVPVSAFLLEEIVLGSVEDVRFVHLVLRSACTVLPYSKCLFSIKLVLEILRSWTFNPPARRPAFLVGVEDKVMDEFIEFYVNCLHELLPGKHAESEPDVNVIKVNLGDRLDVYKEAVYFIRALALQAFFLLSPERWLQVIDWLLEISNYLLSPQNDLEKPFLSNEDSLLCESILGCLLRAGLPARNEAELRTRWKCASTTLMLCAGNEGLIEEWCRVTETLATLLIKDGRFVQGSVSRSVSALSPRFTSPTVSPAGSTASLPTITVSFAAWSDHPVIRSNSIALFRNILRIIGDFSALDELRKRPQLMIKIYESLERICAVFLKCRSNQSVKIEASAVPPIGDLLPAALSAVLNLTCPLDGGPDIFAPIRTICWRILGRCLFRPADIVVPEHFWASLLLASRRNLCQSSMDAGEITSFMHNIALPISTASIPGCSVIVTDIVDALLRFFNDSLWSGQVKCSAREASAMLPATMKFCLNALSLSATNPSAFGHLRDSSCLLRLFKLLSVSLTDPDLQGLIYATAGAGFVNECARGEAGKDELGNGLFEMMLEALKLKRGVKAALAVSDYLSALAFFPAQFVGSFSLQIVFSLIEACLVALNKSELLVVDLVQGPLSDWLLHYLHGNFPNDALKNTFLALVSTVEVGSEYWIKCSSACASILALSQRLLIYKQIFPSPMGPSLLGSLPQERKLMLSLSMKSASTILSFEMDQAASNEESIFVTSRNPFGCFTWKFEKQQLKPLTSLSNESSTSTASSADKMASCSEPWPYRPEPQTSESNELEPEIPKQSESSKDVLKRLMNYLTQKYPDCEFKTNTILAEEGDSQAFKLQMEKEAEFIDKNSPITTIVPTGNERPYLAGQSKQQMVLRHLLTCLGFTLPEVFGINGGAGVHLLKDEHFAELEQLDTLAPRQGIKIGCLYVPKGAVDERELLPARSDAEIDACFIDFLDALAAPPGHPHYGFTGGLLPTEPIKFSYLGTPNVELAVHQNFSTSEVDCDKFKRHLGNDSVLIIWHDSSDTLIERNCLRSEVTSAIIRIMPHSFLTGWYQVNLQTCFERVLQPRKFARLRADAFMVMAEGGFGSEEARLAGFVDGPGGGIFSFDRVQGAALLVPQASLGAVVRALAITAAQRTYWLEGSRSSAVSNEALALSQISAAERVKLAPESVRKDCIDSIISKYSQPKLPYHRYLSKLF